MHVLICMFICIPKYNILRVYNFTHVYVFRTYHLVLVKQLLSSLLQKNVSLPNMLRIMFMRFIGLTFGITRTHTLKENSLVFWLLKSFCLKLGSGITHL